MFFCAVCIRIVDICHGLCERLDGSLAREYHAAVLGIAVPAQLVRKEHLRDRLEVALIFSVLEHGDEDGAEWFCREIVLVAVCGDGLGLEE